MFQALDQSDEISMYISSYVKGGIKIRAKYFILENRLIENNNHVCICVENKESYNVF